MIAMAGSPAEAFMSIEALKAFPEIKVHTAPIHSDLITEVQPHYIME
jgi:hypothetical protein